MQSQLDRLLLRLLAQVPDWREILSNEEVQLVTRRLEGVPFRQLGLEYGLTSEGVRVRLYGRGIKNRRRGGILGLIRGQVVVRGRRRDLA